MTIPLARVCSENMLSCFSYLCRAARRIWSSASTPIGSRTVETRRRDTSGRFSREELPHGANGPSPSLELVPPARSCAVFLMSRCYGSRPHDNWHAPDQLVKNTPCSRGSNPSDGLTECRGEVHPPPPYLATDRSPPPHPPAAFFF